MPSDKSHKFLILTALSMEAKALEAALPQAGRWKLQVIGIRGSRLAAAIQPGSGTTAILLGGLAGALDPSLKIGDIVADAGHAGQFTKGQPFDLKSLPVREGRIISSPTLLATAAAKAGLFSSSGALAVDMESAVVQAYAQAVGLPLLTIRAISDTAEQDVPVEVLDCIDDLGNPRPAVLAVKLARHPSLIPKLMRLGQHSRAALENLGKAVAQIVNQEV